MVYLSSGIITAVKKRPTILRLLGYDIVLFQQKVQADHCWRNDVVACCKGNQRTYLSLVADGTPCVNPISSVDNVSKEHRALSKLFGLPILLENQNVAAG